MTGTPLSSDQDLEANRRSVLSEPQRARLRQAQRAKLLPELGIVGVGVVLMVLGFVNPTSFDFSICLPVGVGVAIYALYLAAYNWRKFSADLSSGQVSVVSGYARPVPTSQRRPTSFWIDVGNMRFAVSAPLYEHFMPGQVRAYYAPRTLMLLALERLATEEGARR